MKVFYLFGFFICLALGVIIYFLKNNYSQTMNQPMNPQYEAIASYYFDDVGKGMRGGVKVSIDAKGNTKVEHIPEGETYEFTLIQEEMNSLKNAFSRYNFLEETDKKSEKTVYDTGSIFMSVSDSEGKEIHRVSQHVMEQTSNFKALVEVFRAISEKGNNVTAITPEYEAIASYYFDDVGQGRTGGIKMTIEADGKVKAERIPGGKTYTFSLTKEEMDSLKRAFFEKGFFKERNTTVQNVYDTGPIIIEVKDINGKTLAEVSQDSYNLTANFGVLERLLRKVFEDKNGQY